MQKSDDKNGRNRGFVVCAARGAAISAAVMLIVFAVFAALVASGRTPEIIMGVLLYIAAFLGCLAGSVAAIKSHGSGALAMGLSVSGALFIVSLVGAAFSETGGLAGAHTPGLLAALFGGGIVGSLLCVRKKGRRRT